MPRQAQHPSSSLPEPVPSGWQVIRGRLPPSELREALTQIAGEHGLRVHQPGQQSLVLADGSGRTVATVRWRPCEPSRAGTMSQLAVPEPHLEILIDPAPAAGPAIAPVITRLAARVRQYSPAELAQITAAMPLTARFSAPHPGFAGWALIFRDHYVENTLGFLLGARRAGIPAEWILALAKGDRTRNRDRIHATLTAHGIASGLLDNTAINAAASRPGDLARSLEPVDAFTGAARAAGRRILVIDDGGLLAQGYGRADAPRRADAAVELTVSGLKRIAAAGPPAIPVFNMARSRLKTQLGYPEIAGSCLRRLQALIPARKLAGRIVLVIGYGALGSRIAAALAAQGCQVHVTDTDPLALITAAEAGHPTHRTVTAALSEIAPFLVAGTTGDEALTPADLRLLPDHVYLAPFATRDFSLLTEPGTSTGSTRIPGLGRDYALPGGSTVTVLGDGRSLNLFEADAIPNEGYDAYRAGTLIAAAALCRQAGDLPPGVHTSLVDEIIAASGLYEAYYDTYLAARPAPPSPAPLAGISACVVGYGVAGRLHAVILAADGAPLTILDPKHQDLPRAHQTFRREVTELPDAVASAITLWSVCCPTADHLPVLRSILTRNPAARVLLEKPACQGHEISELASLLAAHPAARVLITDQYQHSTVLPALAALIAAMEPGQPFDEISITFSKDRSSDISHGRFVDRSYGVLGYEWLHMLAVLRQLIPPAAFTAYLAADPAAAGLRPVRDRRLFVSALTEHASIDIDGTRCQLTLSSSITSLGTPPSTPPPADLRHSPRWQAGSPGSQNRHVTVRAGRTTFTACLDPVTTADGWQLARNHHRITAERSGQLIHDQILTDSPLHTAIQHAARALTGSQPLSPPDLAPLRRIAAIAQLLRSSGEA